MKKIFSESKIIKLTMIKVKIMKTLRDNTAARQYTKKVKIKYLATQKQLLNYSINKILQALLKINKATKDFLKFYNLAVNNAQM